jgi:hypothetical protein
MREEIGDSNMPKQPNTGAAQLRADLPEQESVRTTIVGGRPPGSGQPIGQIPRGLEVLLKKASVDAEFRELLLADANQAAASIELALDPVESAMLQTIPKEQLLAIINQTEVPQVHRRTFLEKSAAAMLLVLTGGVAANVCCLGNRSDKPPSAGKTGARVDVAPPDDDTLPEEPKEEEKKEPESDGDIQEFSFGMRPMR